MSVQHTPGPWEFVGNGLVRNKMPEGVCVADCGFNASRGYFDEETRNANARLIAAAPEMLEALIECLECEFAVTDKAAINKARAALAKARAA